ncbi:MAG: hypothetical protein ACRDNK_05420 [Solirubrobacteraceae bacterium]
MRTLISELVFTLTAISKLAARGISTDEVLDLPWNRYRVVPNPHGPDPERRFLIGQTNAGRVLTVVIAPTDEATTWLVITGWEATLTQRRLLDAEP